MSEAQSVTSTPAQAQAKRPRPVISCLECRRKKLKCSRTHPCQQCIKIGRPGRCEYQAGQEPESNADYSVPHNAPNKRQRFLPSALDNQHETACDQVEPGMQVPPAAKRGVIEDLQERVTRLEQALLAQSRQPNGALSSSHLDSPRPLSPDDTVNDSDSLEKAPSICSQVSWQPFLTINSWGLLS